MPSSRPKNPTPKSTARPEPGGRTGSSGRPGSAEPFRLFIEAVEDYAIFMLDVEGNVVSWNLGAERIKGYKADEIIGRHFSRFYTVEDRQRRWPAHVLSAARKDGHCEDEGWRVRKDGTRFWADVVVTAIHDKEGRLTA